MSYFNKVVAYIDLFERGEKRKNIGFVKIIQKDDSSNIQITLKGLKPTDTMQCLIKELDSGKSLDELSLIAGQGNYQKEFESEKVGKSKISFADMGGIQVIISNDRYGIARWKEKAEETNEIEETEEIKEKVQEVIREQKQESIIENMQNNAEIDNMGSEIVAENLPENWNKELQEKTVKEQSRVSYDQNIQGVETLAIDKWQQLCQIYPLVHPFEHGCGEYLSIEPKDFVILQEKYQGLVNNSFLLHGYYNYRHVLLGKKTEGGKAEYYIGVPGNYYSREKTVAVMFGFEIFESTKEEKTGREQWSIENISQGTYGYYMCKVEL